MIQPVPKCHYVEHGSIRPGTGLKPEPRATLGSVLSPYIVGLHWPVRLKDPERILSNHCTRFC
jgi:hypothetical protein